MTIQTDAQSALNNRITAAQAQTVELAQRILGRAPSSTTAVKFQDDLAIKFTVDGRDFSSYPAGERLYITSLIDGSLLEVESLADLGRWLYLEANP